MNRVNGTELSEETTRKEMESPNSREKELQMKIIQEKYAECNEKVLSTVHTDLDDIGFCSPTWDDVFCWPKTRAGEVVSVKCPDYIHMFHHHENATKHCTPDGTWFISPKTKSPWTNYSLCTGEPANDPNDQIIPKWLPIIKTISQVGYSLSLGTLIIAFFILISIKKLRCPRNTLHMHLFVSFMCRAFMALLKDSLFIDGVGLSQSIVNGIFDQEQANWECKLVTTLWQYFIVANYTWILMEGLYLHNLIFLAPFSDSSAITLYVILGWGLPIPVIASWVMCRINWDDSLCWTTHNHNANLFLIIRIPIIVTIVLNFLFFVNITRVLLVKLQSAVSIETRKYRYRKWAKSTLVLVPLFGVHYMIFIGMSYYIGINPHIEVIWLFSDQLFASFQGCCVAVLYCLLNGEVRCEISKKWRGWRSETTSKSTWVPLHHITSRFHPRSTNDEGGLSATSVAGVLSNCTATRQPLTENSKVGRSDREITEEHQIELTQGD